MENLDVIFRAERRKLYDVTAVFPTEPGTDAYNMSCYAHIGQHSTCSPGWYNTTRAAKPAEYADLLAELHSIYAPEYELVVKRRITPQHRAKRREG